MSTTANIPNGRKKILGQRGGIGGLVGKNKVPLVIPIEMMLTLGGGLKYVLFSPLHSEMIQFD